MTSIWSDVLERQINMGCYRLIRMRKDSIAKIQTYIWWRITILVFANFDYWWWAAPKTKLEVNFYCTNGMIKMSIILFKKLNIRSSISASQCFYADKYLKESVLLSYFGCVGRMVKLSPFHGDDAGSIPARIILSLK